MSEPDSRPTLVTRVGRSGFHEHVFMGRRVFDELVTASSPTQLLALSILGRPLTPTQLRVASRIAEIQSVADPRIPPLMCGRLAASEGRALVGIVGGLLAVVDGKIGPGIAEPVAGFLLSLVQENPECEGGQVGDWLRARKAAGSSLPGFGIAFRGLDERVAPLREAIRAEGHQGKYWSVCETLLDLGRDAFPLPPNIGLLYGALLLDLGFDPPGAGLFANLLGIHCFVANAYEGAQQQAEILRELPAQYVEYVGPGPRVSPRKLAAQVQDEGGEDR